MIVEQAVLDVAPDVSEPFEAAFDEAKDLIRQQPGFRRLRLLRRTDAGRYLLLVEWDHLEDHTQGFRRSADYERWRALLHRFYDPFPTVEHDEPHVDVGPRG